MNLTECSISHSNFFIFLLTLFIICLFYYNHPNSWWCRASLHVCVGYLGFLGGSAVNESACNAGDLGSIPWLGRSPGDRIGHPLQYSGLENPVDCISMGSQRVGHD